MSRDHEWFQVHFHTENPDNLRHLSSELKGGTLMSASGTLPITFLRYISSELCDWSGTNPHL